MLSKKEGEGEGEGKGKREMKTFQLNVRLIFIFYKDCQPAHLSFSTDESVCALCTKNYHN